MKEPALRQIQRLRRDVQAARKVLMKIQHCEGGTCPMCGTTQPFHANWCQLWKELKKARERPGVGIRALAEGK